MTTYPAHRAGRMAAAPMLPASNAALLIDFDNVTLGVRSDLTKELRHLLDSDIIKGKVSVQRAYADWRRYPQYIVPLSESSIDLIFAPAFGTSKKNATDIRLAIDATELVFTRPEIGTFILLSGDSDFSSLVIKLKEYGKYVIGVGIRESASDILIQNCDEYFSYTELAGLTKETDTPSTQRDPWELVVEAIQRMVTNRDVMRADRLKQVMQQIDPNFDEGNAGFNRFSKFVQEAGTRGLISLSKMENGQLEVGPSTAAAAKGSPAGHAPRDMTSAPKTTGGRGRGRGRGGRGESAAVSTPTAPASSAAPTPSPSDAASLDSSGVAAGEGEKERGRRRRRGGRGRNRGQEERSSNGGAQALTADALPPAAERIELTLAEAFHLMSRALGELPPPVSHEALRGRMAALLGREDALLTEQRFPKLLRQANDAEVADVRMLDETHFEVSPHKADLAMQRRPSPESGSGVAEGVPTATAAATGVRFRSGSVGPKRNGAVRLVGVVTLDDAEPASPPLASEEQEAPVAAPTVPARSRAKSTEKRSPKESSRASAKSGAKKSTGSKGKEKPAATTPAPKETRSPAKKSAKGAKKSSTSPKSRTKS